MKIIDRIKADPRAKEVWNEGEDGWWVMLADGYCWPEGQTHAVHEWTIKRLWNSFKTVAPCSCGDCTKHQNQV
jgi:hypothetical protein